MKWFRRQRYFLDFILASLLRRKWRNASLMIVYTLVVFIIASVLFFSDALRKEAERLLDGAPEMIVQRVVAGRHALIPTDYVEKIEAIRGVRGVRPRLWGYYYHPASGANYTLMVPDQFPHGDDAVAIGAGVARTWETRQDGRLYFKAADNETVSLAVADQFQGRTELVSADLILLSEHSFRKIAGVPEGLATDLSVKIRNLRESPTIAKKVTEILPDTRPILREEILRTYASLFDWRSGYIIVLLSGAFLAFLIFAWDKATGLSAEERGEIGILKAVGWDTSDVLTVKFWEGVVISLTAFLIGVLLAYGHVFLARAFLFEHALKGWSVLYPDFKLYPAISAFRLAVLFLLTVAPYTFVTIIPSWRVAVTDPDRVMR